LVRGVSEVQLEQPDQREILDSVEDKVLLVQLVTLELPDWLDRTDPSEQLELSELEDCRERLAFQVARDLQDLKDREVRLESNVKLMLCLL